MVDEHKAHKAILAYEKGWLAFSLTMLFVFIALIILILIVFVFIAHFCF